jgi:glycosyltransferase involved in cell wall biosynthesis
MPSVLVELEKLKVPHSGLGQFCLHVGAGLASRRDPGLDLAFYVPGPCAGAFGGAVRYVVHSPLHRWTGASREPFDVWHCIHQDSRYLPPRRETRLVLTIHDLNFLQKYGGLRCAARLRALQRRVDRADAVTFISAYTEAAVRERLRLEGKPTRVVYNGNSLPPAPDARRPPFAPSSPFLFTIGIVQPKKNFHVLVPFLRALGGRSLVVAGDASSAYARSIARHAADEGVADRVILAGSVTEEEKYWLYANAEAFVFPSLAEGFGLPVIEAMSLGKPAFLSTRTSLPETGGAEAFYWDDFDPAAMRAVYERGMAEYRADPGKPARLRQWAARFSWERAAREYLRLYEELAALPVTGALPRAGAASRT